MNFFGGIENLSEFIKKLICCSTKSGCGDSQRPSIAQRPVEVFLKTSFCCDSVDTVSVEIKNKCCAVSKAYIELKKTCCANININWTPPRLIVEQTCCTQFPIGIVFTNSCCENSVSLSLGKNCCSSDVEVTLAKTCCDTGKGQVDLVLEKTCCDHLIQTVAVEISTKCCGTWDDGTGA